MTALAALLLSTAAADPAGAPLDADLLDSFAAAAPPAWGPLLDGVEGSSPGGSSLLFAGPPLTRIAVSDRPCAGGPACLAGLETLVVATTDPAPGGAPELTTWTTPTGMVLGRVALHGQGSTTRGWRSWDTPMEVPLADCIVCDAGDGLSAPPGCRAGTPDAALAAFRDAHFPIVAQLPDPLARSAAADLVDLVWADHAGQ